MVRAGGGSRECRGATYGAGVETEEGAMKDREWRELLGRHTSARRKRINPPSPAEHFRKNFPGAERGGAESFIHRFQPLVTIPMQPADCINVWVVAVDIGAVV